MTDSVSANGPRYSTLVDVATLTAHLDDPDWCIIDCRHQLSDRNYGRSAYAQQHVPGALFLHLDDDLSGAKTGTNGRHPLPSRAHLAARLCICGIDENVQVVAIDDNGGMAAARLWWLLRWMGHDAVAVLDGGHAAWQAAGGALRAGAETRTPRTFAPRVGLGAVDAAHVARHLNDGTMVLIDARAPDRFRGKNETLDPVGGHIPGARNRFFQHNLHADGGFKPAEELRADFFKLLGNTIVPERVVHQCGSGVSACHNLLAMEIAGLSGSQLYAGSWSEWCANPGRPRVTGG